MQILNSSKSPHLYGYPTKLMFVICLFGLQLAHAEIFNNVTPVGDFVPESAGSETVIPVWTKLTGTTGLANAGTFHFNVFKFNTVTKLFSTPIKSFPNPTEACGVSKFNPGDQGGEDFLKFVKTSGTVFALGKHYICQVFDVSGNPTGTELNYAYVYMTDLASKQAWIYTSKTEELVGLDVIPDQNGNVKEELAISFYGQFLRVLVVDSATGAVISNKNYSAGTP